MQFLRTQLRAVLSKTDLFASSTSEFYVQPCRSYKFVIQPQTGRMENNNAEYWTKQNEKEFPIQQPGEEPRNGYINHVKNDIPVSWKNLWYIATLVQGMSVDEAIKQLSFVHKKGAYYVKEAILEAQDLAVKEHNIEFRSNLWVSQSFTLSEKIVFAGFQRKAKRSPAKLYRHRSYYFVRLQEGSPPKDFGQPPTGEKMFEDWLKRMRGRRINDSI